MKPSCRARFAKGTFEMTWELAGQMLEVCNCGLLCPCWMNLTAPPDRGWCGTAILFDIERGNVGGLDVAGRKVVMTAEIPGAFANGNFTVRLYVDEGASAEQLRALEQLFTGQLGGPMTALGPAVTTLLPTRVARIMVQHGEIVTAMVSEAGRLQWAPCYDPGGRATKVEAAEAEGTSSDYGVERLMRQARRLVSGVLAPPVLS